MRVADRPLPPVVLDTVEQIAHWPVRPVIAIAGSLPHGGWDDGVSRWDVAGTWWDRDPSDTGWLDATCQFYGLTIDHGTPDDSMLVPASQLLLQLDNSDGRWSGMDADGTQSQFGPGTEIQVWGHGASGAGGGTFGAGTFGSGSFGDSSSGGDWWLFAGRVARWDQRADDSVEVEAFDSFSDLAQPFGSYTPGAAGQTPDARLTAILNTISSSTVIPHRFDTGSVALTAQLTDQAPLEEMQTVATSDGGLLMCDSDGTLLYLDRLWRDGRDDQAAIPSVSGNVPTADVVVWDPLISTTDQRLADYVALENVAHLRAVAGVLPGYQYAQTDQQWTTQLEGNALADLYLDERSGRVIRVEEFALYLFDPHQPNLWRAVDWRRLDRLRFVQDRKVSGGGTLRVDIDVLLASIVHEITPDGGWTMTVGTSRGIAFNTPVLYDTGELYDTGKVYGY